eukprot:284025_1
MAENSMSSPHVNRSESSATDATDGVQESGEPEINVADLAELKKFFDKAEEGGSEGLGMEEFVAAFGQALGKNLAQQKLTHLFMKIDANSDGSVDWDEFTNYLLMENQGFDKMEDDSYDELVRANIEPASNRAFHHRDMVTSILHLPKEKQYLTVSRDGTCRLWSSETLLFARA